MSDDYKPGTFKKGSGRPPYVDTYKEPPIPKHEERRIPVMPGRMLTTRLIKPVVPALLLVAALAWGGTTVSAPQGGAGACPFPGCRGTTDVLDVTQPPFNAAGNGAADDTGAIQRALDQVAISAVRVFIPCGRYKLSAPLLLRTQPGISGMNVPGTTVVGAGACTIFDSDTTGTGFTMLRSGGVNRTCTGGAGACDVRLGRSGRGAGCYCQAASDCTSGTCTDSPAVAPMRGATLSDFSMVLRKDNMVGLDMTGISDSSVERVRIQTANGLAHTNNVAIVFDDDGATAYTNTILSSSFMQSDIGMWFRNTANGNLVLGSRTLGASTSGNGSNVVIEGATNTVKLIGMRIETTKAPICGSPCTALTCCGGYNHGATCAVATDCAEGDILIHGGANMVQLDMVRIEDSNNPHVRLGCPAAANGPCPSSTAATQPVIIGTFHSGSGTPYVKTNVSAAFPPVILERGVSQIYADGGAVDLTCGAGNIGAVQVMDDGRIQACDGQSTSVLRNYVPMFTGATAPFTCSATVAGAYFDTSCSQVCICGQTSTKWCRSDTGVCNTSTDCC